MTKLDLLNMIEDYKHGHITPEAMLTNIDSLFNIQHDGKPNVCGWLPQFTANDVDGAYFLGVFNTGGIDGLQREVNRIKEFGFMPHQLTQLLKFSGNDR